jgi:hypothetical protein
MVPGTGILAALRRKSQIHESPAPDETKFAAREAAVLAVEQAVAAGSSSEPCATGPKGRSVPPPSRGDQACRIQLDDVRPGEEELELQVTPVTRVASAYVLAHLRQTAVSEEYITYGLKQGHIRVLHRFSEARALLKGHTGPIADICFVGDDIIAAGGQDGELYAWRLSLQDGDNAVHVEQVLHAKFSPGCDHDVVRIAPCVSGPAAVSVAATVGNAVLLLKLPNRGDAAIDVEIDPLAPEAPARKMTSYPPQDPPTAVAVSLEGRHLAAGSKHGRVYITEITPPTESLGKGAVLDTGSEGSCVSSIHWLASGDSTCALLVSMADGMHQAVYKSNDNAATFALAQTVILQAAKNAASYIHTASVAERRLIVLMDTPTKAVYTLHYDEDAIIDYFARFKVGMPVINFSAHWDPDRAEAFEDGAVELTCVQADAVQQYLIDPALCSDVVEEKGASEAQQQEPMLVEQKVEEDKKDVAEPPGQAVANGHEAPVETATQPTAAAEEFSASHVVATRQASTVSTVGSNGEGCLSPPPSPAVPAVTVCVPIPVTLPDESRTQPASAGGAPRLLTPKDLLPTTAGAEDGEGSAGKATPTSMKLLQRPQPKPAEPPAAESSLPVEIIANETPKPSESLPSPAAAPVIAGDLSAAVAQEMSSVHRKFAGHVSAMYKELLKAMKSEMAAQASAQQSAMTTLLREALAAQASAVQAERAAVMAEERAGMERLLASVSATLNKDLPTRLAEAVRAEIVDVSGTMVNNLTPAVQQAVAAALPKETSAAVKAALDKQLAASIQTGLTKPLQDAFRHAFSKQLVPSFEQACQSMFLQIDKTFTQGFREHMAASQAAFAEPTALAEQLKNSLSVVQSLSAGADAGRSAVLSGALLRPQKTVADTRAELGALIASARYEEAFSAALGLQDAGTVAWLCSQADAATVLSGSTPLLSQMVLLSLIQQLSSDLSGSVSGKLQWIREAAMVLNPHDPLLIPHLKHVLEQVHANLAAEVPRLTGGDASSCKLAMHVVHSQLTS